MSLLDQLLEAERAAEALSEAHVERLEEGLHRAIKADPVAPEGDGGDLSPSADQPPAGEAADAIADGAASVAETSGMALAPWLKAFVLVALGAGAGAATTYQVMRAEAERPTVSEPSLPPAPATTEPAPSNTPETPPVPVETYPEDGAGMTPTPDEVHPIGVPSEAAPSPLADPSSESPTSGQRLADERALVDSARQALVRGEPEAALRTLQRHRRRHRRGEMREERDALEVVATVQAGRNAEAERLGRRYLVRYPSSLLAGTVRAALADIDLSDPSHGSTEAQ